MPVTRVSIGLSPINASHVNHASRRRARHKDLTWFGMSKSCKDSVNRISKADEKTCHFRSCDRDRASIANLLMKQRNDGAARRQHVAIANTHEPGSWTPQIALDENALLQSLGHAHG